MYISTFHVQWYNEKEKEERSYTLQQEKVQPGHWFLTKTHPNSVKTILGLNVQGGNSVKSMLFYPDCIEQNPCRSMNIVITSTWFLFDRTISIPTLDAQSQNGFYAICSIPGWVYGHCGQPQLAHLNCICRANAKQYLPAYSKGGGGGGRRRGCPKGEPKRQLTLITILLVANLGSEVIAVWSTPNMLLGLSAAHTPGLQLPVFKG